MPTVKTKSPYAEITLQNGEKFKVTETFSTVMRHQKEALENDLPLMDLMGPDGTRIATDPVAIISVTELRRPTRAHGNGKVKSAAAKKATKATTAKSRLAKRRARGRARSTRSRTAA